MVGVLYCYIYRRIFCLALLATKLNFFLFRYVEKVVVLDWFHTHLNNKKFCLNFKFLLCLEVYFVRF
jgi:hypothetical protein